MLNLDIPHTPAGRNGIRAWDNVRRLSITDQRFALIDIIQILFPNGDLEFPRDLRQLDRIAAVLHEFNLTRDFESANGNLVGG